jgi:hypothetical protein
MHNLVDTTLCRPPAPDWPRDPRTTFGYIGTPTHAEDFRPLVEPLRALLLERPDTLRAVFIGYVPAELDRLPNTTFLGLYRTYQNAAHALTRAGVDVGLAPLANHEFNRAKSAMKYLEYGACRIPCLFSDVEPYRPFVRDGENGILVRDHTPEAWGAALRRAADRPDEVARMGARAFEDVTRNHSVEARLDDFLTLYRGAIEAGAVERATPCGEAGGAPGAGAPERALILNLYRPPDLSLGILRDFLRTFGQHVQEVIVIAWDDRLREILRLDGRFLVVAPPAPFQDDVLNAVGTALSRARADSCLYVDERCSAGWDLERLLRLAAPDLGAVGPLSLALRGGQCAERHVPRSELESGQLRESLADLFAARPAVPASNLEPDLVLLNRRAILDCGGVAHDLTWEDALTDLCSRLAVSGRRVEVCRGAIVDPRADFTPSVPAAPPRGGGRAGRGSSRARLARAWTRTIPGGPSDSTANRSACGCGPAGTRPTSRRSSSGCPARRPSRIGCSCATPLATTARRGSPDDTEPRRSSGRRAQPAPPHCASCGTGGATVTSCSRTTASYRSRAGSKRCWP